MKKRLTAKRLPVFLILILGAGTMYKLYFIDSIFYVQMQEYMGLSHTQIGLIYSVAGWVSTFSFLIAVFVTDRFSKRKLISISLILNGLTGILLSFFPSFHIMLILFCFFAIFTDMLCWPTMLKSIRLLGNAREQGKLFGILEGGEGLVDTIVSLMALGIYVVMGSNINGFRYAILFFSFVSIANGIASLFVFEEDTINANIDIRLRNKKAFEGMKRSFANKDIWLVAWNVFMVYSIYTGIKYFMPFLKEIYALPLALVSLYGIINTYFLKFIGGVVGGFMSDKVTHSAAKFIHIMFINTSVALSIYMLLPHTTINVNIAILLALTISAFVYFTRSVYFAPMGEIYIPKDITGAAMALGSFIGYLPGAFMGVIYGSILDGHPGIEGYRLVFMLMAGLSILGIFVSKKLVRRIHLKTLNINQKAKY